MGPPKTGAPVLLDGVGSLDCRLEETIGVVVDTDGKLMIERWRIAVHTSRC
jgi:hypothetical protein